MHSGRTTRTVDENLKWCHDAVQGVSRTFAITIDALREPMSSRICVGYLLCRIADTVEDAGHVPAEEKADLLRRYDRVLAPSDPTTVESFRSAVEPWIPEERTNDWDVVASVPRVTSTYASLPEGTRTALRGPVRELVSGMATFVERHADTGGLRIETVEELEEYCWYAAGTVGDLITNLLVENAEAERATTLEENARSFALLLQLVNVAKDVSVDYDEENNVYLPATWLDEAGIDADEVADPARADDVARVVERVTEHAAGYLDDAQAYLEALPETDGNTLSAWAIPYLLAVATIRELRDRPTDVVTEGTVKVPRTEVHALIQLFETGSVGRDDIGDLRARMAAQPLHRADDLSQSYS
ncbi:phytoene/squalene synthase family protein [Halostella salina]|uniref:phytoene/squalene synthase family protein n=1 Tax=Halostella salina TaxID=1547897 RepID=UPI000EF7FD9C|nr:phytoene/squalene synthase family protein [Halostella salina]